MGELTRLLTNIHPEAESLSEDCRIPGHSASHLGLDWVGWMDGLGENKTVVLADSSIRSLILFLYFNMCLGHFNPISIH